MPSSVSSAWHAGHPARGLHGARASSGLSTEAHDRQHPWPEGHARPGAAVVEASSKVFRHSWQNDSTPATRDASSTNAPWSVARRSSATTSSMENERGGVSGGRGRGTRDRSRANRRVFS